MAGSIYQVIAILILIVCVLLILIVLVQNSKGGGLTANFTAANQVMGARRSADFLEKATWSFAVGLLFLCLVSTLSLQKKEGGQNESRMKESFENVINPDNVLSFPTAAPDQPASDNGTGNE